MSPKAWLVLGAIAVTVTLAFGTFQVVSLLARSTDETTTTFEAVRHLEIGNDAGRIRLRPSTDGTLRIEREVVRGLTKPSYSERREGDRLIVDAECRGPGMWCRVQLDVSVPAGVSVDASGGGGSVRADGLDAGLRLRSSGGGITVVASGPVLDLSSSGGSVSVEAAKAREIKARSSGGSVRIRSAVVPDTVDARSSGGSVTVEVPDGPTAYRVDASSSGGSTRTEVRADPTSARRITADSSGGSVTVRYLSPT
ncbi:MAG TPA: DUF4097 family beta strand repeat-containing protein [Acidimicrobiales bacterium]|nr:DUF4097 family beta strand repeat-containing protein [Acidimicrobiales bacterium]